MVGKHTIQRCSDGFGVEKKPKPVIAVSINTSWNIYNFRGSLIRAFVAAGYEVLAVAPHDEYSDRLESLGCRFVPLEMDNKGTSLLKDALLFLRFWLFFRRERPDIFLGYTIKPNVYGSIAAHSNHVPVINNVSGLGTAFIRETWLTRVVRWLYWAAFKRSRTVFFQNKDDRDLFIHQGLVIREKALLLPGSGVDLNYFQPRAGPARKAGFVFLLVARLLLDKGVREFVEGARLVRREVPSTRFQLLGPVDAQNQTAIDQKTIDDWCAEHIVEYLGATDDVRPFVAEADCVVLPSYREGTPRSLLEGAAMGKPLIATDVPGCREVVDDGVNGFLCCLRDSQSLAEQMLQMVRLPDEARVAMGRASRVKAEREFDEQIVIKRYLDALEAIRCRPESSEGSKE